MLPTSTATFCIPRHDGEHNFAVGASNGRGFIVETVAFCVLQLVTLRAIPPLAGQRGRPLQQVPGLLWSENISAHSHSIALKTLHLLWLKIVSPLADTECRAEKIAGQTSGSLAASARGRENCERQNDCHSSGQRKSASTIQMEHYKSHAVPLAGGSSRKSQAASHGRSCNAAAQRELQETSMRREPWNQIAEKLFFWGKKSKYDSNPLQELVRETKYNFRTTVACAKNKGLSVIEMPRATVKRWIDANKATLGNPCSFNNGDADFLSFRALCFTDVEPAVIITSATPLYRSGYSLIPVSFQIACEIITVACERLMKGGALPESISPRTIYLFTRGRQRSYCFLPSEAPPNANRKAGISSSVRGIADVVDYFRQRIKESDFLTCDFSRREFTQENAEEFLKCRLKDAGLEWLTGHLRPLVRRSGCVAYPKWNHVRLHALHYLRPKLFHFVLMHNVLVTAWQNVQSSGQDVEINYARALMEYLGKLVDVLREGTVASLFRAWELSQPWVIQNQARIFAKRLVRFASKQCR